MSVIWVVFINFHQNLQMKFTLYILLTLLVNTAGYSQKVLAKVTYFFEKNIGTGPLVTEAELFINNESSDFIWSNFKRTRPFKPEDFGLPPGTPITVMNTEKKADVFNIYTDFKNNKLYETDNLVGQRYIVWENRLKINWYITNEQKKIDNYNVTKATGKFRGRNYTVWFTPEIPVNAGPWKLNGLPGLIMEAEDDAKAITLKVIKIEMNASDARSHLFKIPQQGTLITLKEYIEKENTMKKTLKSNAMSKLSRENDAKFPEFDRSKYRLEFEFEWENYNIDKTKSQN